MTPASVRFAMKSGEPTLLYVSMDHAAEDPVGAEGLRM